MDVNTGHVVNQAWLDEMEQAERERYVKVPRSLTGAAHRALGGRHETTIDLKASTKLAAFAARKRKERRKAARNARKRNHG